MKKSNSTPDLRLVKSSKKQEAKQEVQVSFEITNDALTDKEKAELIKGAKRLLQDIFAKNPEAEVVIVDDTHADTQKGGKQVETNKIINFSEQKLSRNKKNR